MTTLRFTNAPKACRKRGPTNDERGLQRPCESTEGLEIAWPLRGYVIGIRCAVGLLWLSWPRRARANHVDTLLKASPLRPDTQVIPVVALRPGLLKIFFWLTKHSRLEFQKALYAAMTQHVSTPTEEMSAELQAAFDHFNRELFGGEIPPPLLTLQRQKQTAGYFTARGWVHRQGAQKVDEISLNPKYFAVQTLQESMKVLVMQMTFAWQTHYGKPGRRRYANKDYAEKLQSIGLMPSHTGRPGGRMTGEKIDAYVIEGGPFDLACKKLLTRSFALSWLDRFPVTVQELSRAMHQLPEETHIALTEEQVATLEIQVVEKNEPASGQYRFVCPLCNAKVWGKKGLDGQLSHLPCGQLMVIRDPSDSDSSSN